MKNPPQKIPTLLITLLFLVITQSSDFYTNQEAFECFYGKGIETCQIYFRACKESEQCLQQLTKFNKCSFEVQENKVGNIFNGYCFQQWKKKAVETFRVINCLSKTCNLAYNSLVGHEELYRCSQILFLNVQLPCQEECQEEIYLKIGLNIHTKTLQEIYTQHFDNLEAKAFSKLIYEDCILQGGTGLQNLAKEQQLRQLYKGKRPAKIQPDQYVHQINNRFYVEENDL